MKVRTVSLEYLVSAYRDAKTLNVEELERLVTNGRHLLNDEEWKGAVAALQALRSEHRVDG